MAETAPDPKPDRPRGWKRLILIVVLTGLVGGYLISYVLPTRYQAQATVLVEGQKVPDSYVAPIITTSFAQRVQSLSQMVLSPNRLRPVLQSLGYTKPDEQDKLINDIQQNLQVEPVITTMSEAAQASPADANRKPSASDEPLPGFVVIYTDNDALRSQKICNAMTSAIVDENLRWRSEVAQSTMDFLSRQVDDASAQLVKMGAQLIEHGKKAGPRSAEDEAQQKVLALEYDVAQKNYADLVQKKYAAGLAASMESQQEGEQMHIAATASLPEDPSFPHRVLCAEVGSLTGLAFGIGLLLRRRFRPPVSPSDVSISNEGNPPTDATDAPTNSAAPHRSFFRRQIKD